MSKESVIRIVNVANIVGFAWMLARAMFCSMNIHPAFRYGCYYLFLTTWGVEFILEERWRVVFRREQIFFGLLVVFFVWGFLYYPIDGDVYFKRNVELRYPLLAFGIVGIFGMNRYYTKRLVFSMMSMVSAVSILYVAANVGLWRLVVSPERTELFSVFAQNHVSAHMAFDLYLVMTLIGIWWMESRCEGVKVWERVWHVFVALLCWVTLGISDGRSGMGIALIVTATLLFVEAYKRNRWVAIGVVAIVFAVGGYAISQNKRMTKDSLITENRFGFWRSAVELIAEKPLLGYGMSNAQEEFDKVNMKYLEWYQQEFFEREQTGMKDCHNQFLQTTLEFGVVGLVLLMGIYLLPCFVVKREWRMLTCVVVGGCVMQSLFDMFITGQLNLVFCLMMVTCLVTEEFEDDGFV